MMLTPKNWLQFQHYKNRNPPWIRLHKRLLDDFDFCCLPLASRALAPLLWLLASEAVDGQITLSPKQIAFRVRMSELEFATALKPLIDGRFFSADADASGVLAECLQRAPKNIPDTETETETETDKTKTARAAPLASPEFSPEFLDAWAKYPKRPGANKRQAAKAWHASIRAGATAAEMLAGCEAYRRYCDVTQTQPNFVKQPATFFGPAEHYRADWTVNANGIAHANGRDAGRAAAARAFMPKTEKASNDTGIIDITPPASGFLGR